MKQIYKFILSVLLTAVLLSAFSLPLFADDNATAGNGNTESAKDGYGYYRESEYLWKVTLFVGKSDTATKYSNLRSDYYQLGTVIMKRSGWTVSSSTQFGSHMKTDYYGGTNLSVNTSPYIISDSGCPAVPIACGGNIYTVRSYFGSTGTLTTVLNAIASQNGTSAESLLTSKSFTIGGTTKSGWPSSYLKPNGTSNRVPWLIVYEPMVVMHLKDGSTKLAFTATEFAIAQKNGWYDWHYSGGSGQAVDKLTHKHLPTSVQLEEAWFGYPVYNVTNDNQAWSDTDIIRGGGWGMRWLGAAVTETPEDDSPEEIYDPVIPPVSGETDYACYILSTDQPTAGSYGNILVEWKNWTSNCGVALCEIYLGSNLVYSSYKYFEDYGEIYETISIYYPDSSTYLVMVQINYENRYSENDPDDNAAFSMVTPTVNSIYEFSVSALTVDPVVMYQGSVCMLTFTSSNWDMYSNYYDIPIEIFVNGNLVYTEYVFYYAYGTNYHTFNIYIDSLGAVDISVRVNGYMMYYESNPYNNTSSTVVYTQPYYEFSVSDLTVFPSEVYEEQEITLSFRSDNWDQFNYYASVPVEVIFNNVVIYTEYIDYYPYGSVWHNIVVNVGGTVGDVPVYVRINWNNHDYEVNPYNNETSALFVKVKPKIDLSVEAILPNSDYREGVTVITSYKIYNNSREDITPEYNNSVSFEVYYYENDSMVTIATDVWNCAVIPGWDYNLVYFKWTVPIGTSGKTIYCKATVNSDSSIFEPDRTNNEIILIKTISKLEHSQTPDTKFEKAKPDGFALTSAPDEKESYATWKMWEYLNGEFVQKSYGLSLTGEAMITPDGDSPSSENDGGIWTMRSGYGITLEYIPKIVSYSGYFLPDGSAYTSVQCASSYVPEYCYSDESGKYRMLDNVGGNWMFCKNENSDNNDRLHFIPIWYPDGNYTVSVCASEVWTPSGMIKSTHNSNSIIIKDSAYDDWYIGRQ